MRCCRWISTVVMSWLGNCLFSGCVVGPGHLAVSRASWPEPREELNDRPDTTGESIPVTSDSTPLAGCRLWPHDDPAWQTPKRWEHGLTIILPGVEGASWFNRSIARGLVDAGHQSAIVIEDWTTGLWPLFPYHLMAHARNETQARRIAERIVAYQDRHPDCPVNLIGHSGGGAMAVLVLESLPADREISQAILLGAALSPHHDLRPALKRTSRGLWNVHSAGDVFYLGAGTLTLGTIDREFTVSAGCLGFESPAEMNESDRLLFTEKLHQVPYEFRMARSWNFGGHFGFVNRTFVTDWVAPILANAD